MPRERPFGTAGFVRFLARRLANLVGKKKPIPCPRCHIPCVEVGHAISYPRKVLDSQAPGRHKTGRQYRYTCPRCGAEYLHETIRGTIDEIPKGADFRIRWVNGQERIQINSPHVLKFWGLSPEWQGTELTSTEVTRLQRRAQGIRHQLSHGHMEDEVLAWEQFRLTPQEIKKVLGRDI